MQHMKHSSYLWNCASSTYLHKLSWVHEAIEETTPHLRWQKFMWPTKMAEMHITSLKC